jgi:hypothetical protein
MEAIILETKFDESKIIYDDAAGVLRGEEKCVYCGCPATSLYWTHPGGAIVCCSTHASATYHFTYIGKVNDGESQRTNRRLQGQIGTPSKS